MRVKKEVRSLVSIAINIIFFWVLGMTMQAKTVKELPDSKPAIIEERKLDEPVSLPPIPAVPAPFPNAKPGM